MKAVTANVSLAARSGGAQGSVLAVLILVGWCSLCASRTFSQPGVVAGDKSTTATLPNQQTTVSKYTIPADEPLIESSDWGKLPKEGIWNRDNSRMVLIPAGEFTMGLDNPQARGGKIQEGPAHKVFLSSYYIDKYEVTFRQFDEFCKRTGHISPRVTTGHNLKDPDKPVVSITWDDAKAYADWVGKQLPTEAQWEKAARGDQQLTYPWGADWAEGATNTKEAKLNTTVKSGAYPMDVSPYGVFDLAGNASEWCRDWYDRDYYKASPKDNPEGPTEGVFSRVVRGGDYYYTKEYARLTSRRFRPTNQAREECGFRCVKVVGVEPTPSPTPDLSLYLPPTPTPVDNPFQTVEPDLFKAWIAGQSLPFNLSPVNAGRQATVTVVNSLPVDIAVSVVSTEPQIVVYDTKIPALEKKELKMGMDKDLGMYVKIPKPDRIVKVIPIFRSNSRPAMVLVPDRFLPTCKEVGGPLSVPPPNPEMDIYYESLQMPWNEVYFFNDASTTVTLKFPERPVVRTPAQEGQPEVKPYLVSVGPQTVWEATMLPGKHTFTLLYLGTFESGAKPREIDVSDKNDRRAVIIQENTRSNERVRVFARMLPTLDTTVVETKVGGLPKR